MPEENAAVITDVLAGKGTDGARAAVLLNAAGALYVAGKAESLPEAIELAGDGLDSGVGLDKLQELREVSNRVG